MAQKIAARKKAHYAMAGSVDDAVAILARGDVTIVAGGTDYFPALSNGCAGNIVDISQVAELSGITQGPAGWRIGAATTFSALIAAELPAAFDGLRQAARKIGSVQIQNVATIGGNICNASPAADSVPVLLTLDAQIEIAAPSGRRLVPLDAFITGVRQTDLRAGEMVTAIIIPDRADATLSAFLKLGSRTYLVISIAMVAVVLEVAQGRITMARVAVGACGPVARRLPELEAALLGMEVADLTGKFSVTMDVLGPLSPMDDLRASGAYRFAAVAELCQRALREAVNV